MSRWTELGAVSLRQTIHHVPVQKREREKKSEQVAIPGISLRGEEECFAGAGTPRILPSLDKLLNGCGAMDLIVFRVNISFLQTAPVSGLQSTGPCNPTDAC